MQSSKTCLMLYGAICMRESSNQGECRHTLDGVFAGLLEVASRGLWQLMHRVELFESLEYFLKHTAL